MDWKLEVIIIPVSDVDRAKAFYADAAGFTLDVDRQINDNFRVVQFTPPGSACSVTFGQGLTGVAPGSAQGMHLMVADVEAACAELVSRGVEVEEIHHFGPSGRVPGPHPEHNDYETFSSFSDPDGNTWMLQERGWSASE